MPMPTAASIGAALLAITCQQRHNTTVQERPGQDNNKDVDKNYVADEDEFAAWLSRGRHREDRKVARIGSRNSISFHVSLAWLLIYCLLRQ
ncbi:uncharacterized protein BDZ99DRAFT_468727 [Mytilinidion resinicola]|uniref:Uncharacterized protein n=1 Tax=Mytilinidion resinicola TaxID=574789 RepID=A0A6A6Y289_9PEZI|nr:uncharacterized protein BDZ99DRAFT_468727 [Mytilinidion resinicola]KAF2802770.1 hypothetical protein BDZ99DRAFT_468727 [Mytilinidion resinicola]